MANKKSEKLEDTPYKKVKVSYRDSNDESPGVRVGTNNVIENGKRVLKQYRIKVGAEVELPVTVIDLLKSKYRIVRKNDKDVKVPLLYVEEV
jgi:hypothetical protein